MLELNQCYFSLVAGWGQGKEGKWGMYFPRNFMGGSFYVCVLWVTVGQSQGTILSWEGSSPKT